MSQIYKPRHVAIITDGNRRWASERGLPKFVGHTEGAKNLKTLARTAIDLGIPYLTLWGMSTENLKRTEPEVKHLFSIFGRIIEYTDDFETYKVKLKIIGNPKKLPDKVQKNIADVQEKTKNNAALTLTLALIYGGRDEIIRATRKIIAAGLTEDQLDEDMFVHYLDTGGMPDVDLVIRTGGHKRLSGYLPWQTVYAELYFTDLYFPAFGATEFKKAVDWFGEQKRNFGT